MLALELHVVYSSTKCSAPSYDSPCVTCVLHAIVGKLDEFILNIIPSLTCVLIGPICNVALIDWWGLTFSS